MGIFTKRFSISNEVLRALGLHANPDLLSYKVVRARDSELPELIAEVNVMIAEHRYRPIGGLLHHNGEFYQAMVSYDRPYAT